MTHPNAISQAARAASLGRDARAASETRGAAGGEAGRGAQRGTAALPGLRSAGAVTPVPRAWEADPLHTQGVSTWGWQCGANDTQPSCSKPAGDSGPTHIQRPRASVPGHRCKKPVPEPEGTPGPGGAQRPPCSRGPVMCSRMAPALPPGWERSQEPLSCAELSSAWHEHGLTPTGRDTAPLPRGRDRGLAGSKNLALPPSLASRQVLRTHMPKRKRAVA